jgi:hypothetical protein
VKKLKVSLRPLILALSFANLCFFAFWKQLLIFGDSSSLPYMYLIKSQPPTVVWLGIILDIIVFSVIVFFLSIVLNRLVSSISRCRLVASVIIVPLLTQGLLSLAPKSMLILIAAYLLAVWLLPPKVIVFVTTGFEALLMILAPFILITFGTSIRASYADSRLFEAKKPDALSTAVAPKNRVIWILFDEWDYRLTFEKNLHLPETDSFRGTSFSSTNAYSPARMTIQSVPMLITGTRLVNQQFIGPRALTYEVVEQQPTRRVNWSDLPNVFSDAKSNGYNVGIIGWYLPYCRLFDGLSLCEWWPLETKRNSVRAEKGLATVMLDEGRSLFENSTCFPLGLPVLFSLPAIKHIQTYHKILESSLKVIADPRYDMVFLHYPVPHAPYIYSGSQSDFKLSKEGYLGNIALVDRTIGILRKRMEEANVWDSSTVILTADHWLRASTPVNGRQDQRVPFLIKMAHQKEPVVYDQQWNTIITRYLLQAVMKGDIVNAQQIPAWIDSKSAETGTKQMAPLLQ